MSDIEKHLRWLCDTGGRTNLEAAAAIEALVKERDEARRKLFPYAEDKEISGVTWNGFYLIGNRKSVDEFKRLENRAAQLETYRAEFVRRNEAAEAEVERLKGVLGDGVRMAAAMNMTAGWVDSAKQILGGKS